MYPNTLSAGLSRIFDIFIFEILRRDEGICQVPSVRALQGDDYAAYAADL